VAIDKVAGVQVSDEREGSAVALFGLRKGGLCVQQTVRCCAILKEECGLVLSSKRKWYVRF